MHRLQAPDVIAAVERAVGAHRDRRWRAGRLQNLDDRASHPAGILLGVDSDGLDVFVKFHAGDEASTVFRRELDGLALLRDKGGARTAVPIGDGLVPLHDGCILVLEAVTERSSSERTRDDWRAIGTALAMLHATTGPTLGLHFDGCFGPLPQSNTPVESNRWADYFRLRRIEPYLDAAIRSGNLPDGFTTRVDGLTERLEDLCGPDPVPTLLHGDAQQNNYLSTDNGALFVDASPFFGHPENDLAMLDIFEPVPSDVLDAYREVREIDPAFEQRRELWRIPVYLAVIAVDGANPFGRTFIPRLDAALATSREPRVGRLHLRADEPTGDQAPERRGRLRAHRRAEVQCGDQPISSSPSSVIPIAQIEQNRRRIAADHRSGRRKVPNWAIAPAPHISGEVLRHGTAGFSSDANRSRSTVLRLSALV